MPITHIQLLSVPVADHDRAKAFYVDTLGCQLIADNTKRPGPAVGSSCAARLRQATAGRA